MPKTATGGEVSQVSSQDSLPPARAPAAPRRSGPKQGPSLLPGLGLGVPKAQAKGRRRRGPAWCGVRGGKKPASLAEMPN